MDKERKALCWSFVIIAVVALALLLYSTGDASNVGKVYLPVILLGPRPTSPFTPTPTSTPTPTNTPTQTPTSTPTQTSTSVAPYPAP